MSTQKTLPILTRANFKELFSRSTGQVGFPNPFDYEGDERKRLKKIARYYLSRVWSSLDSFGWHQDPYNDADGEFEGWFGYYGEYSEMALALLGDKDGGGGDEEYVVVLASEESELITLEDGSVIQLA